MIFHTVAFCAFRVFRGHHWLRPSARAKIFVVHLSKFPKIAHPPRPCRIGHRPLFTPPRTQLQAVWRSILEAVVTEPPLAQSHKSLLRRLLIVRLLSYYPVILCRIENYWAARMWIAFRAILVYIFTMGFMGCLIAFFVPTEETLPLISKIGMLIAFYGFPLVVVFIDIREHRRRKV